MNYLGFDEARTQEEIREVLIPSWHIVSLSNLWCQFIASLPAEKPKEEDTVTETTKEPATETGDEEQKEEAPAPVEEVADNKEAQDAAGLFGSYGGEFESFAFASQGHDHSHDHAHEHAHDHTHENTHDHVKQSPRKESSKPVVTGPPIEISTSEPGSESAITKALLIGNFEAAVQCCLRLDRVADALILAAYGGPALWAKTQEAYFARQTHSYAKVMSSIVRGDLEQLVLRASLKDWKAALAALCTYTKSESFPRLCRYAAYYCVIFVYAAYSVLGDRLDQAGDTKAAILCYICAGSIDKTVGIWVRASNSYRNPYPYVSQPKIPAQR